MTIKCSQCDKEAIDALNNGKGPAFCLEHMNMYQNMISRHLADLQKQEDSILDYVEMTTGVPLRPSKPTPVMHQGNLTVNNLKIDRSNIGVVNTGTVNDINASITFIENTGNIKLANGLKNISEKIIESPNLEKLQKAEVLEQLSFIGNEIRVVPEKRNNSVIKSILKSISNILSISSDLTTLWLAFYPLVKSYFGF
ncbi:MAG: hypothetical protein V1845_02585 [bacterium]